MMALEITSAREDAARARKEVNRATAKLDMLLENFLKEDIVT